MAKSAYTMSRAALRQRRAAAAGKPAREWTNVRVETAVVAAIDARRGRVSRNSFLAGILNIRA